MATKTTISYVDDLDGTEAAESVKFAIDGKAYEIDLSEANAAALRDAFAPFVAAARKAAGGRALSVVPPSRPSRRSGEAAEKRRWLAEQGFKIGARGRFSVEMDQAWNDHKQRESLSVFAPADDTPAEAPEAVSEPVSARKGEAGPFSGEAILAAAAASVPTVRTRVKQLTRNNIDAMRATGLAAAYGGTFAIIDGTPEEALRKVQDVMDAEPNKKGGNYPSLVAVRNKLRKMEDRFIVTEAV